VIQIVHVSGLIPLIHAAEIAGPAQAEEAPEPGAFDAGADDPGFCDAGAAPRIE
jgi:hypothetical protein